VDIASPGKYKKCSSDWFPWFLGAFVLPFLVMVVLVGMPLLLLELGLGQKLRLGAAAAWPKVRLLKYVRVVQ
jgi:hypothetical protein